MSFLRPKIKGWVGEVKSNLTQHIFLDSEDYHYFNNIILKEENISTQIDHILVSKYGIFVVETKNMDGWIFGNAIDDYWTQTFFNKKQKFQNPLKQNYRHTMSLSKFLGINHDRIISIVMYWGNCKFKTRMPENVICGGIQGYTKYIKSYKNIVFTDEEVNAYCDQLQSCKDNMNLLSGLRHVISTKKRFESTNICPRCGGNLLEKHGTKGRFIGCENFPKCRYTKAVD